MAFVTTICAFACGQFKHFFSFLNYKDDHRHKKTRHLFAIFVFTFMCSAHLSFAPFCHVVECPLHPIKE